MSPKCLKSEETDKMYRKHLSALSIFGQTAQYFYTPVL